MFIGLEICGLGLGLGGFRLGLGLGGCSLDLGLGLEGCGLVNITVKTCCVCTNARHLPNFIALGQRMYEEILTKS